MKAKIDLMHMNSEAGYVPSFGYTEATLFPASEVAPCGADKEALWELEGGTPITEDMLEGVQVRSRHSGANTYITHSGIFDVPDGKVVVQRTMLDISTNDRVDYHAWIVDPSGSLQELYRERADEYAALASK